MAIGYRGASPRFREGGTVILLSVMAVQMLSENVVALSSVQLTMRYTGPRLGSMSRVVLWISFTTVQLQAHFSFFGPKCPFSTIKCFTSFVYPCIEIELN